MQRILVRSIFFFFLGVIGLAVYPSFNHQKQAPVIEQPQVQHAKATNFAPGQLREHFLKHGYQFGSITEEDYLVAAQELLNASPGKDILEKTQFDGDIAHYNPKTHEFAVMTPSGRIRTYFISNDDYWNRQ